jgi:hypothetical protein
MVNDPRHGTTGRGRALDQQNLERSTIDEQEKAPEEPGAIE